MKIKDLLAVLDSLAPLSLAYEWDNVGLQIGDPNAHIESAIIALEVNPGAIKLAKAKGANLILTHHPLIFSQLKNITHPLYLDLIKNDIAVISLHTNLDNAIYSVNHCLANALGLKVLSRLSLESGSQWYHLSLSVPVDSYSEVRDAAFLAGAGRYGNYTQCSTGHEVLGTFCADMDANPQVGERGRLEELTEMQLDLMVDSFKLEAVKKAILAVHPYETPALYYYPVSNSNPAYGLGLICENATPIVLKELKKSVADKLQSPVARLWTAGKDSAHKIQKIAICGGSGASLIRKAAGVADVLISGDLGYHAMLDSPLPLIDAGHLYTEYPVLEWLQQVLVGQGLEAEVLALAEHDYALYLQ